MRSSHTALPRVDKPTAVRARVLVNLPVAVEALTAAGAARNATEDVSAATHPRSVRSCDRNPSTGWAPGKTRGQEMCRSATWRLPVRPRRGRMTVDRGTCGVHSPVIADQLRTKARGFWRAIAHRVAGCRVFASLSGVQGEEQTNRHHRNHRHHPRPRPSSRRLRDLSQPRAAPSLLDRASPNC